MATTGRPRDTSLDDRVLDATIGLLAERGYASLRIDDVAAASGVAKTTIYRRWPSLMHLVVAAIVRLVGDRAIERTDDPEADLRLACLRWVESLGTAGDALPAVALDMHRQPDADLRRLYRESLIDPVRDGLIGIIADGQASGRFRTDADPSAAADALIGAAVYRLTILHQPVGATDVDAVLPIVVAGLRTPASRR